ncbi:MAG: hypothetical protein ACXABY_13615 [Candidatus Thorarchaeota archaeon]
MSDQEKVQAVAKKQAETKATTPTASVPLAMLQISIVKSQGLDNTIFQDMVNAELMELQTKGKKILSIETTIALNDFSAYIVGTIQYN